MCVHIVRNKDYYYNQSCYDMCLSSISVPSSNTFNNHYLCDFIWFAKDDLC